MEVATLRLTCCLYKEKKTKKSMPLFLHCMLSSHTALWVFSSLLGIRNFSSQYRITPALWELLYNTSSCQISLVYGSSASPCATSLLWCKHQVPDSKSRQSPAASSTPKPKILLLLKDGNPKFTRNHFLVSVFADRVTPSCM